MTNFCDKDQSLLKKLMRKFESNTFPRSSKLRGVRRWNDEQIPTANLYSIRGRIWWSMSDHSSLTNKFISGILFTYIGLHELVSLLIGTHPFLQDGVWYTVLAYVAFPIMLFILFLGLAFFAIAWAEPYENIRWRLQDRIFFEKEDQL